MSSRPKPQLLHAVIDDKVFVAQNVVSVCNLPSVRCFYPQDVLQYLPLCDDFGPMGLPCVTRFIELLEEEIVACPSHKIVYCVDPGRRALTNAIFLLGAYLIFKLDTNVQGVSSCFSWLNSTLIEPFRDATYFPRDFDLTLEDCWGALVRAKTLGWIRSPTRNSAAWGQIDIDEYTHYENPLHGDLCEVIPGKCIAFRGPVELGELEYRDDPSGHRLLGPRFYARIFRLLGIKAVVRLNEPGYDAQPFVDVGMAHHDLPFDDCTPPPEPIVQQFLDIVDNADGLVAIHCKAGLGRTGTVIARFIMRTYAFSAREAIAWLRIMRPGSIIGSQQHYLEDIEKPVKGFLWRRVSASGPTAAAAAKSGEVDKGEAAARAAQVAGGMQRRASLQALGRVLLGR